MFANNQVLEISGNLNLDELQATFSFALQYLGFNNENEKLVCKSMKDGKYYVGWGFKNIPNGWSEYSIDDIDILNQLIYTHIDLCQVESSDKSRITKKGFVMRYVSQMDKPNKATKPIIYFKPFTCIYLK